MKLKVIQIYTSKYDFEQDDIDEAINSFLDKEQPKEIISSKIETAKIYAPKDDMLNECAIFITIVYNKF